MKPLAPKLSFVDTHSHQDAQCDLLKPDICIYSIDDEPEGCKPDFSKIELFVELKSQEDFDPFDDSASSFEKDTDVDNGVRGQLASYTAALAGRQFRIHSFCVLVFGPFARFIRWDRAGAIVTRRFNYIKQPHLFVGFFWRYENLGLKKGCDHSVLAASATDLINPDALERMRSRNSESHREFRTLLVPGRHSGDVEKRFVVSFPPKYTTRSPFGRATRPMFAFDVEANKIVFLKDYWRPDVAGIEKEGEIYELLEGKNVPNIPSFGTGNDVLDHKTVTDTLRHEGWACKTNDMVPLRHYRMSLDVVGIPLSECNSSRQLVTAIADAMEGENNFADFYPYD